MTDAPESSAHGAESPPSTRNELWTVTFAFYAHDELHAFTAAQHAVWPKRSDGWSRE